jgi:hypothetical protein
MSQDNQSPLTVTGDGKDSQNLHIINCNIHPESRFERCNCIGHESQPPLVWDLNLITLLPYRVDRSATRKSLIRHYPIGWRVLNVNVLDYLLEHQELIPEEWKQFNIYFIGTYYAIPIYKGVSTPSLKLVPYLFWDSGDLCWCTHTRDVECKGLTGQDRNDYVICCGKEIEEA